MIRSRQAKLSEILPASPRPPAHQRPRLPALPATMHLVACAGLLVLATAWWCIAAPALDPAVAALWAWLRLQGWYRSVYLETVHVLLLGPLFYVAWFLPLDAPRWFPYQVRQLLASAVPGRRPLDSGLGRLWPGGSARGGITQAIAYGVPLLLLDTFTRKFYHGVDLQAYYSQPYLSVQHARLLPMAAPTVQTMTWQILGALAIYDAVFYWAHRALHWAKAGWALHHPHHAHATLHHGVTNQLHMSERVGLILLANAALKLVRAHPLTRNMFTVVFVGALMHSHCGYQVPWDLERWVPGLGGAMAHWLHHTLHDCNFAPFFTWWDELCGTAWRQQHPSQHAAWLASKRDMYCQASKAQCMARAEA